MNSKLISWTSRELKVAEDILALAMTFSATAITYNGEDYIIKNATELLKKIVNQHRPKDVERVLKTLEMSVFILRHQNENRF